MQQIWGNKYEVIKALGCGGMGEVFLVRDMHLGRLLAAKRVTKEQSDSTCFKKEAEFLKELEHPMLPAVYDFFEEGGSYYLIMEYVEGITLENYLKKNKRPDTEQAVKWVAELTEVLGYLHNQKPPIVYGDLKPENIMIKSTGEVKLIDLGACSYNVSGIETSGGRIGTKGYAPPEQWRVGGISAGCDIYALGAVFHEMLTGISPTEAGYRRRPVREYDRSIPKKLNRIIERCTKERPKDRYESMESLREDLLHKPVSERLVRLGWKTIGLLQVLLWCMAAVSFGCPFFHGIPETDLPFPYLYRPLLVTGTAFLFHRIFFRKRKQTIKKIEKSVLATEKKFDGLLTVK